ncbi:hypothetical protein Esti_003552 [Eimeria stiedai]
MNKRIYLRSFFSSLRKRIFNEAVQVWLSLNPPPRATGGPRPEFTSCPTVAAMGPRVPAREARGPQPEAHHQVQHAGAAPEPLPLLRRPPDETCANPLRGCTYSGQQQRQQAALCTRLLDVLAAGLPRPHQQQRQQQQQQQQQQQVLVSLATRASQCAEGRDPRGATAAVLSFLKELAPAVGAAAAGPPLTQQQSEVDRRAVELIAAYTAASTTANAAEVRVQRHALTCISSLFRRSPLLASQGSPAVPQALGAAAAAAVTLQRLLGAEPRPKTHRGMQRHMQQQQEQQHIVAAGLAAAQPKQTALLRALLLSIYSLLAELLRARGAAAAAVAVGGGAAAVSAGAEGPAPSALQATVGEISIELLLLLLPLSTALPAAAGPLLLPPLQVRGAAASGWGPPCDLTTDFASTQESEADACVRLTAARGPPVLSWRRGPFKGDSPSQGAPQGTPSTPRTPRSAAATVGGADAELGVHSVRAEGLRCVEALLRLSGRELFPYWGFLLHRRAPRLMQQTAQAQWGPLLSSALAASSQARGPFNLAPTNDVRGPHWGLPTQQGWQQQALDLWLLELLGAKEEQQELPWAILATGDESAKVQKAALGCLCALLGAPPLRQWPDSSPAPCMHCGPRALLMDAAAWALLVGPLGFREVQSGGGGPPQHSSCCCSSLPSRQQQQAAGSGAYTSLSTTVAKASRCAVHALFAVARSHLVGLRPACSARAAETSVPVEAPPSGAAAAEAAAAVQPHSPPSRCNPPGVRAACEQDSTSGLGAIALRGLSEALPALPLGLLPPGVTAAALLIAHPVVLLLAETLQEQRRRQLLLSPRAPTCSFCLGVEANETTGPEWSALNDAAAAVAQRAQNGTFTFPAAAATTAARTAAADCESASKRLDADPSFCEGHERGLRRQGLQKQRPERQGLGGPFEAFATQVLGRGASALRYVTPCLALVAAVLSRRQRQPQAAEALLLPLSSTDVVAGPSCLAALACRAVQDLASLRCHSGRRVSSATQQQQQQAEASCPQEAPPSGLAKKGSKPAGAEGEGPPADRLGNVSSGFRCSGCERHASTLMEGLLSLLQAIAKRYPQVLLLLKGGLALTALDLKTEGAPCGSSWAQAWGCDAQTDAAGDSALLAMLRSVLFASNATMRTRAAAFALELLQPASAAEQGDRQEGFAPADSGDPTRPPHFAGAAGGPPYAGAAGSPPPAGSGEAVLQASRRSLVDVLHTSLLVPLLEEGAPSSEGGEASPCSGGWGAPCSGPPAVPTEQLGLACSLLCRLSSEEWQRLGLRTSRTLEVLCSFALPNRPRSVRLAAAAALGAFGAEAMQPQQAQRSLASGAPARPPAPVAAAATGAGSAACTDGSQVQANNGGLRKAVLCLLLQLADPLPDVRAAALCALCEVAGRLQQLLQHQQQQQQQQQQLSNSIGNLWGAVLRAINDALQAGEKKAAVAAAGLRAVGAVVPLLLLSQSLRREEAYVHRVTTDQGRSLGGAQVCVEAIESGEEGGAAARDGGRGGDEEVIRSLALLECALRLGGETGLGQVAAAGPVGPHVGTPQETSSIGGRGDALLHERSGKASASVPDAAAAGLKRLKLHWNACHSIRLIFSCPAASLLLQDTCCRALLPSLWFASCDCLSSSQLAKVRCHAAAALRAVAELLGSVSSRGGPTPQQPAAASRLCTQLCCMRCLLRLLTEAWRAVEVAATKAALPTYPEGCGERGEPRTALRRYRESLRSNVEGLVASGLLACTEELLNAKQTIGSLERSSPPAGGRFESQCHTDELLTAEAAEAVPEPMTPCNICGGERNALLEAADVAFLRQTMDRALQAVHL